MSRLRLCYPTTLASLEIELIFFVVLSSTTTSFPQTADDSVNLKSGLMTGEEIS